MAHALMSIIRLISLLMFLQSVALYRIYTVNNDVERSGEFGNLLGSSIEDDLDSSTMNYGNENDENLLSLARVDDSLKDDVVPSGPFDFEQQRAVISKRSPFSFRSHSSKSLPQRRNNRPHWNPLIAAYKRCGDHADREYRETCFKNAIQMLFVYKL